MSRREPTAEQKVRCELKQGDMLVEAILDRAESELSQ